MKFGKRKGPPLLASLLAAFCDGRLSEPETEELRTLLGKSREARRYYLHYLDMHLDLVRRAEIEQLLPINTETFSETVSLWNRPWFQAAAAVVLVLGVAMALVNRSDSDQKPNVTREPIAFVSRADGVVWASKPTTDVDVGSLLPSGRLALERGDLRLDFFNGVALTLRGPVDCDLTSVDEMVLNRGQLAALVPESASGFAVRTPQAMIIDIGSEFALNVLANATSQVSVVDGEVIASLSGKGGATLEQTILEGEAYEINPASFGVHAISAESSAFVAMLSPAPKPLPITDAYVAAVKQAKPIGYWRFERVTEGVIANEMSERYGARVLDGGPLLLEGNESNKVAVLPEGQETGGLRVEEPFEGLNVIGQYSLELWMNPLKHDWSTLASLIRPEPNDRLDPDDFDGRVSFEPHLMSLECMPPRESNCWVDHEPRVLRCYQLRSCRGQGPNQSANLFSKRRYVPGQWRHLAVTRDGRKLSLYLDGELENQVEIDIKPDESDYQLLMGRYTRESKRFAKLFAGRIDEVALYDRALTQEEIADRSHLVHP